MKINEQVNVPNDESGAGGACGIDPEALGQLKAQFHDFVVGTRRRLASVADQLREIERERERLESQRACDFNMKADQSEPDSALNAPDVIRGKEESPRSVSRLFPGSEPAAPQVRTQMPSISDRETTSGVMPASGVQHQAEPSVQHQAEPSVQHQAEPSVQHQAESSVQRQTDPPSTPGSGSSSTPMEADSDPLERLNAIKARLAKQIEGA